jgi:hypothetical protein
MTVLCKQEGSKKNTTEIELKLTLQWIFNCSPEEIGKQYVKYDGKIIKKSLSPRERPNIFSVQVMFTTYLLPHCFHYLREPEHHPKRRS